MKTIVLAWKLCRPTAVTAAILRTRLPFRRYEMRIAKLTVKLAC